MSKILFIFFAFLFIFNINYFCNFTSVSAESDIYYRITSENSALYKTPTTDDSLENIYFILIYFIQAREEVAKQRYWKIGGAAPAP